MPAPTALKQAQPEIIPADIPLPDSNDNDIELTLDALLPAEAAEMEIDEHTTEVVADEELRPKFAPAKDYVRTAVTSRLGAFDYHHVTNPP
jgi:RNA-binding protein PNO1